MKTVFLSNFCQIVKLIHKFGFILCKYVHLIIYFVDSEFYVYLVIPKNTLSTSVYRNSVRKIWNRLLTRTVILGIYMTFY